MEKSKAKAAEEVEVTPVVTPVITTEEIKEVVETPVEEVTVEDIDPKEELTAEDFEEEPVDLDRPMPGDTIEEGIVQDHEENTDTVDLSLDSTEITGSEDDIEFIADPEQTFEDFEEAPKTDFKFNAEKLQSYLDSYKDEDKIIQESKGGNFVSNRDHTVYVPLALFID